MLRMQCLLKFRTSHIASPLADQSANVANSQGYGKSLWLAILLSKIETLLQIIHTAPPLCNTITYKQSDSRITLPGSDHHLVSV